MLNCAGCAIKHFATKWRDADWVILITEAKLMLDDVEPSQTSSNIIQHHPTSSDGWSLLDADNLLYLAV